MDIEAAKMIGAGLAVIGLAGVGVGLGMIFSNWIAALARNPSAASAVRVPALLGFALTEAVALFALVIAFIILFA